MKKSHYEANDSLLINAIREDENKTFVISEMKKAPAEILGIWLGSFVALIVFYM